MQSASCSHQLRPAPLTRRAAYGFRKANCQRKPSPAATSLAASSSAGCNGRSRSMLRLSANNERQRVSSYSRSDIRRNGTRASRSSCRRSSPASAASTSGGKPWLRRLRHPEPFEKCEIQRVDVGEIGRFRTLVFHVDAPLWANLGGFATYDIFASVTNYG